MASVSKKNKRRREVYIDTTQLDINVQMPKRKSQRFVQLEAVGVTNSDSSTLFRDCENEDDQAAVGVTNSDSSTLFRDCENEDDQAGSTAVLMIDRCCTANEGSFSIPNKSHVLPCPVLCEHCGALKFKDEPKGFCCCDGVVKLKTNNTPDELYHLFTSNSVESIEFKTYVRTYNSNFSFTSFGVHYDKELCKRNKGIYTFRIQGQIYHFINDILVQNSHPSYMQLYFFDTENEIEHRLQISEKLTNSILLKLVKLMELNPYAKFFRTLTNIPNLKSYTLKIRSDCGLDQRVYNTPSVSQVAAIWVDDNSNTNDRTRDIIVSCNSGEKHQVHYYFGCYDPLQYPLLFPFGETGWHQGIVRIDKRKRQQTCGNENLFDLHQLNSATEIIAVENTVTQKNKTRAQVSCREYYSYKLQEASEYQMPTPFFRLFATILTLCAPNDPKNLWNKFKIFMIEDFIYAGV